MESMSLRHFPELDPISTKPNEVARRRLEKDIADYLARGGQIESVPVLIGEPLQRKTRQEQVDILRNSTWHFNKGPV